MALPNSQKSQVITLYFGQEITPILGKKSLQLQQLNSKILGFTALKLVTMSPTWWIKAIRAATEISAKNNLSEHHYVSAQFLRYGTFQRCTGVF
ncbi:MAG: hypothetical protein RL226_1824 [Bacteroidota bacterium]